MNDEKQLTGYPSIDKPWLKYYSEEAINAPLPKKTLWQYVYENNKDYPDDIAFRYNVAILTISKDKGETVFFYCGAYHKTKGCSKHYITEKELDYTNPMESVYQSY